MTIRIQLSLIGLLVALSVLALSVLISFSADSGLAQQVGFSSCPPPGGMAVAVWQGANGTPVAQATAQCSGAPVSAAFVFQAQSQSWYYFFANAPAGVNTLDAVNNGQIVFLLSQASATPGGTPSPGPSGPVSQVVEEYTGLELAIHGQEGDDTLAEALLRSKALYLQGYPCDASDALQPYLDHVQALRVGQEPGSQEDLFNRGWMLRRDVLAPFGRPALQNGSPCSVWDDTDIVHIAESDNKHVRATVDLPNANSWSFLTVREAREVYTQIILPGIEPYGGKDGRPALPVWRTLVAVPRGAEASVKSLDILGSAEYIVNLYPNQPTAVDQQAPEGFPPAYVFADKPFYKDEGAYNFSKLLPDDVCTVTPLGEARDLSIVQLSCVAAQYNPVTDKLRVFQSVEFEVVFTGGSGYFLTQGSLNPFEPASGVNIGSVLNRDVILGYVDPSPRSWICWGEEFLILTHPDFRSAADDLKAWKRDKGISTTVVEVNDGSGAGPDTATEIDDYIEDHWDKCLVRPSYVLLLGDAEYIPPSGYVASISGSSTNTIGTDYSYSLTGSGGIDILPDVGLARIPVDTSADAQTVVDKIINYEKNPPARLGFYKNASIASQFQCCRKEDDGSALDGDDGTDQRAFIQTSEFVRDYLRGQSYAVERIYTETVDQGNPSASPTPEPAYSGSTTPARYYDGTLLPSDLGASSGFVWSGSTSDITAAFNDGRFLMLHRDHGSSSGWANPSFTTSNAAALTNGELLPVVFSVNCASGWFDSETDGVSSTSSSSVYFMERLLLNANGGMVGGLGDTRNSPTWANNALTRGFFDAIWPNLISSAGSSTPILRLGDILNYGKEYLLTQIGVSWSGTPDVASDSAVDELYLWHAYGDPTQEIWVERPTILLTLATYVLQPGALLVRYAEEGATITALQDDGKGILKPIGRAVVRQGEANLKYVLEPDANRPIILSACKKGAVCSLLTSDASPAPSPLPTQAPGGQADRVIDADGFNSISDGMPEAQGVRLGDGLSDFVRTQDRRRTGVDMFDNDQNRAWTFGRTGDDLITEAEAFTGSPTSRNERYDAGLDKVILDIDGSFVNGQPVSFDLDNEGRTLRIRYHDANSNGTWDNGEDIVLDVNDNGVFD